LTLFSQRLYAFVEQLAGPDHHFGSGRPVHSNDMIFDSIGTDGIALRLDAESGCLEFNGPDDW